MNYINNKMFNSEDKIDQVEYEIWYRKQRRHSYLDYQTIEEFNNQYRKQNMNNVA